VGTPIFHPVVLPSAQARPQAVMGTRGEGAAERRNILRPWAESGEIPLRCPSSAWAVYRAARVTVSSGRAVLSPCGILGLLLFCFFPCDGRGHGLGGRFELRLANGGAPLGPFGFTAPLPPHWGAGGGDIPGFKLLLLYWQFFINLEGLGHRRLIYGIGAERFWQK
jgi:hypothetical protein